MKRLVVITLLVAISGAAKSRVRVYDRAPGAEATDRPAVIVVSNETLLSKSHRVELQELGWGVLELNVSDAIRSRYLLSAMEAPLLVIADSGAVVRRIVRVSTSAGILQAVEAFEAGKASYNFACARCHGEDGDSDAYAFIRKLRGIGSRLTAEQITARMYPLPMGSSGFAVRGHLLSRERLDALVAYVAGL